MRKRLPIFTLVFILLLLAGSFAEEAAPGLDEAPLVGEIQKGKETYEGLSKGEIETQYLEKEWTTMIRNSKYGSYIYKLDPVFRFLFGMEFSFSWKFIAGFLLWIIFISFYYPIFREVFRSSLTGLGVSIVLTSITAHYLSPKVMDLFAKIIQNIWHNLLLLFVLLIMIPIIKKSMTKLTKAWRQRRQERKLKKVEAAAGLSGANVTDIKETLAQAEAVKEGYEEGSKGS